MITFTSLCLTTHHDTAKWVPNLGMTTQCEVEVKLLQTVQVLIALYVHCLPQLKGFSLLLFFSFLSEWKWNEERGAIGLIIGIRTKLEGAHWSVTEAGARIRPVERAAWSYEVLTLLLNVLWPCDLRLIWYIISQHFDWIYTHLFNNNHQVGPQYRQMKLISFITLFNQSKFWYFARTLCIPK